MTISPDGSRIAYASRAAAIEGVAAEVHLKILNVASPENAVTIPLAGFASFRFSPDSRRLFVSGTSNASQLTAQESGGFVVDAASGRRFSSLPDTEPWFQAKVSPDGKWLAVISHSRPRSVRLYSTKGDRAPVELQGHTTRLFSLAFSGDSQRLVTAAGGGQIKTWDVAAAANEPARLASSTNLALLTAVSRDGKYIATARNLTSLLGTVDKLPPEARKNVVTLRDDTGTALYQTAELIGPIRWIKFSSDGRRLAACAVAPVADTQSAAQVCVWDTASGAERLTLRMPTDISVSRLTSSRNAAGAAFNADGSRLAAIVRSVAQRTSAIKVWEIGSGREIWEGDSVPYVLHDLKFSPDGGRVLGIPDDYTDRNAHLTVWDARAGRLLRKSRHSRSAPAARY